MVLQKPLVIFVGKMMKWIEACLHDLNEYKADIEERILQGQHGLEEYRRLCGERAGVKTSIEMLRERYRKYVEDDEEYETS